MYNYFENSIIWNMFTLFQTKCEVYWPREGTAQKYGVVSVTSTQEEVIPTCTIRKFMLSVAQTTKNVSTSFNLRTRLFAIIAHTPSLADSMTHSLINSLTHSFTDHSLTHSLIHSLNHSYTHSLTHSLIHSLTRSLTHSHTHSLTQSLTHSLTHSFTHSLADSLSPSFIHSPTKIAHITYYHSYPLTLT